MTRSNGLVVVAATAMLWFTTTSANAQFYIAPQRTTVTTYYSTPFYGPYINGGVTYFEPTRYNFPLAPTYLVNPGASFGTTINYNSPRWNVGYANYPTYQTYYGTPLVTTPLYQPPVVTPYVTPLLYRRW